MQRATPKIEKERKKVRNREIQERDLSHGNHNSRDQIVDITKPWEKKRRERTSGMSGMSIYQQKIEWLIVPL